MRQFELTAKFFDTLSAIANDLGCEVTITKETKDTDRWSSRYNQVIERSYKLDVKSYIPASMIADYINGCPNRASVLYKLYAMGYIEITGHRFPTYQQWKAYAGPGMTLDHKLPKSLYPGLTFDPDNWQPMSRAANEAKGRKHAKEAIEYLDKAEARLNSICDELISML